MHGQALSFKWGDGASFRCKELLICFRNDKIVPENGTFFFAKIMQKNKQFKDKKFSGSGWYRGQLKRGRQSGQGSMYYLNGDRYVGQWNSGKPEGKGNYFYKTGRRNIQFIPPLKIQVNAYCFF